MTLELTKCLNKWFLVLFELMVAPFGPLKNPKSLENGLLRQIMAQKWVNNVFLKKDPSSFVVHH